MTTSTPTAPLDTNQLMAERREKLQALRAAGVAFPNDFRPTHHAADLHHRHDGVPNEELEAQAVKVAVAGRMMLKRVMGKACFATLQDGSGRIQLYVTQDAVGERRLAEFKHWDLGDILGCEGTLFRTKTGELSIKATTIRLLTKSLRPLPDKFHGMTDQEQKYRQRYVDLITDDSARARFVARSKAVASIRGFMVEHGFLEVETPMLHPIPGGANAKPFVTHHNALDQQMFLRIAPELNLKRLVVGGFERVYEINRNFRNEGVSTQHNPEFTMLELYRAYADYGDLIDMIEALLRGMTDSLLGTTRIDYQGETFDFGAPFARLTVEEVILAHNPELERARLRDRGYLLAACERLGIPVKDGWGPGKLQIEIFEKTAEAKLRQPTFVTAYPKEVSPLSRANDEDGFVTDRFEFFVAGREIANGFSELNDPEEQAARFREQCELRDAGDDEAMPYDEDYIRALEYGLPPTAGLGVGIDRLVMLLTDSASIRDVLLFPHMRPEA